MSYYKGIEFGKKLYHQNIAKYGFNERTASEKIIKTCRKYATDFNIKRTKNGKFLTKERRLFYKGVADCLQAPNRVIF